MKSLRAPLILLSVLYVALLACIVVSASQLPDRIATHFDVSGEPNGWMARSSHLLVTSAFGFAFPLLLIAVIFATRFLPASCVNIPHRDYWLAPERKGETVSYLLRHSLWLACLAVCFAGGLHFMAIEANRHAPPHLPTPVALCVTGGFLVGVFAWVIGMIRHFKWKA